MVNKHTMRRAHDSAWLRRLVGLVPAPKTPPGSRLRLVDLELAEDLTDLAPAGADVAQVLVRLHGQPLGTVDVDLRAGAVPASSLRVLVEAQLGDDIRQHLREDGLGEGPDAAPAGASQGLPPCRRRVQEQAARRSASVIVPTHDRPEQLRTCVRALLALDHPDFEVIVVDNAPSDTAAERIVREEFGGQGRVRYLREPQAGASRARNLGVVHARGDVVAFTDDDAVVDAGWLSALVAAFDVAPSVTCVTGLTLPTALATAAQQAFEEYGGMALGFRRRVWHAGTVAETRLYPYTAGIFGASNNVAFLREPFLRRGGFDPRLGPATPAFGAEDLDAFLALIRDGETLVYEPAALVRHEHRNEFADLYWQVFTYSAGFTAMLTKWASTDRSAAADLARRVPALLPAALFRAHRGGAEVAAGGYPTQLRWLERAGYLYGPMAYARSRAVLRRVPSGGRRLVPAAGHVSAGAAADG